jgi:hypothetical protein
VWLIATVGSNPTLSAFRIVIIDAMTRSQVARFLASGGFAEEDADVVRDLLVRGKQIATQILDENAASENLKFAAKEFLERLDEDAYAKY